MLSCAGRINAEMLCTKILEYEMIQNIIEKLNSFETSLADLPEAFGVGEKQFREKFNYDFGKLRFDSWLQEFLEWTHSYNILSIEKVDTYKSQYDNKNCNPSGSGYGTKSQMVNTVFINPFLNIIESIRRDVKSGKLNAIKTEFNRRDPSHEFISLQRIYDLEALNSSFDLKKLIAMTKELNTAHKNEMYFTVGNLLRAIMDHIPPLFNCNSFKEIYNNYSGTKSFKDAMAGLDLQMRKISDSYLHTQIRTSEILPTAQQVDVKPSFDLLLSEIIRVSQNS